MVAAHARLSLLIRCRYNQLGALFNLLCFCTPSSTHNHRSYRTKHGAPGLSWDPKLAAAAQAWADTCPWSYSSEAEGGGGAVQYGENMGWGYDSFVDVVEAWYSEVSGGEGGRWCGGWLIASGVIEC